MMELLKRFEEENADDFLTEEDSDDDDEENGIVKRFQGIDIGKLLSSI